MDLSHMKQFEELMRGFLVDLEDYIPKEMEATNRQEAVASRILFHSLGTALNSESFRSSSLGSNAHKVNDSLNPSVVVDTEDKIQHKINFQLLAHKAATAIHYSGYVDAKVSYSLAGNHFHVGVGWTW